MLPNESPKTTGLGIEKVNEVIQGILDPGFELGEGHAEHLLKTIVKEAIQKKVYHDSMDRTAWLSMSLRAITSILERDPMVLIQLEPFYDKGAVTDDDKDVQQEHTTTNLADEKYLYKWLITVLIRESKTTNQDLHANIRDVFTTIIMAASLNPRLFRCKLEIKIYLLTLFEWYSDRMLKKSNEIQDILDILSICSTLFYLLTDPELRKRLMLDSSYDSLFESTIRRMEFLIFSSTSEFSSSQELKIDEIRANMLSYSLNYFINDELRTKSKLGFLLGILRDTFINLKSFKFSAKTQIAVAYLTLKVFQECISLNHIGLFSNVLEFKACKDILRKGDFNDLLLNSVNFIAHYIEGDCSTIQIKLNEPEFDAIINNLLRDYKASKTSIFQSLLYTAVQYQPVDITSSKQYISTLQTRLAMFKSLKRSEKYSIINSIGELYCIISNSIDRNTKSCNVCSRNTKALEHIDNKRPELVELTLMNSFIEYFIPNQGAQEFDVNLEISKLLTIFKIFSHYQPMKDFAKCPIFKYVMRSLYATNRDIRLQALKIIPLYIKSNGEANLDELVSSKICKILSHRNLNLPINSIFIESTIMGWSLLGCVSTGEFLHPILMKLIDFLASSNKVQSSFAFHELQTIAYVKKKTPWQLLSLVIDRWSLHVAEHLHNQPLLGQKISSLVGMPVDDILSHAAIHIVPKTLTFYQNDIIGRIAEIKAMSKYDLISMYLPKVIAELLTSAENFDERSLLSVLKTRSPNFTEAVLRDIHTNQTVWEVLTRHRPGFNDYLINKSILFVLKLSRHKSFTDPTTSSREGISKFLELNILPLIQNFSDAIRDSRGLKSYSQKSSSLTAVQFIIINSPMAAVFTLPQICTCLQTAFDNETLAEKTLATWKLLVERLSEKHLVPITDHTIATIIHKWNSLDSKCQVIGKSIINLLFDKSEDFRIKNLYTFYSISDNKDLVLIYQRVDALIKSINKPLMLLKNIDRRCSIDNKVVISQALSDLKKFFYAYNDTLYKLYERQSRFCPEVSGVFKTLLHILHKFKSNDDISSKCSKLLGLIGAVNQTTIQTQSIPEGLIVIHDFVSSRETKKFVSRFLDKFLVPFFWAAEDPKKQLFCAFSMQEYLSVIELSEINLEITNDSSPESELWKQFSDISRSTLAPFIKSRFMAKPGNHQPLTYPSFNPGKPYTTWICEFAFDLLKMTQNAPGSKIFELCSSLAKEDESIAAFVLPYVSLSFLIASETKSEAHEIFHKEIITILNTDITKIHHSAFENTKLILESVFSILDYFRSWVRERVEISDDNQKFDSQTEKIKAMLARFPKHIMAKRSLQADSYERALYYMEQCVKEGDWSFGSLESLRQAYANIGDFDALNGILKKHPAKTLDGRITQMDYNENWKMAQNCFEALSEFDVSDVKEPETRLLKSLADRNLYDQCLDKLDLLVSKKTEAHEPINAEWIGLGLQSSILAGRLDSVNFWSRKLELNDSLANSNNLLNYHIGKIFVHYRNSDFEDLEKGFENVYLLLAGSLNFSNPKSLSKNNNSLVLLHAVSDLEAILKKDYKNNEHFRCSMSTKLDLTANDFKANWNILSLRKTANNLVDSRDCRSDTNDVLLKLTRLARKNNRTDLAASSVMRVMDTRFGELEYAKLLWIQGDHSNAIIEIKELLDEVSDPKNKELSQREKAKIQLKYTSWSEFTNSSSSSKIITEYKSAIKMDPNWDHAHFKLADYYNRLLEMRDTERTNNINDVSGALEYKAIYSFIRCLGYSNSYLFEAMPKLIIIWTDFAESLENVDAVGKEKRDEKMAIVKKQRTDNFMRIIKEIKVFKNSKPTYFWYTVLSGLLSRLENRNKVSVDLIVEISGDIMAKFPAQTLWSVFAQTKSPTSKRSELATAILKSFFKSKKLRMISQQFKDSLEFFDELLMVCEAKIKRASKSHYNYLSRDYKLKHDHYKNPCPLVIPIKRNFDVALQISKQISNSHEPFPNTSIVTFLKIENKVQVLSSLQAPKRLFVLGSDGLQYGILCKEDDLRKDAKIMEITTFMGYHLAREKESSKRSLKILTYSVIPMSETHGVIEWVNQAMTLRNAILPRYEKKGIHIDYQQLVKDFDHSTNDKQALKENYRTWAGIFKPVLHEWFIETYPEASSWYSARDTFTCCIAVMSMVGYILSLGDRHSENILLIKTTGTVFHVDFDCVFGKALELGIPELVPFRLTQNLVDAFGITGVEGKFRKACEVTLGLLRKNQNSVMSSLQNFFTDKTLRSGRTLGPNPMSVIKRKLRGILEKEGTAVNVEAQVDYLIQLSTSDDILSQMYHGWLPFI